MSELALRIAEVVDDFRYVLDDDWADALDAAAVELCDEFGIDDVDWMWEQINNSF